MNFIKRLERVKYNKWVTEPIYSTNGTVVAEHRYEFIDELCSSIEAFLFSYGYTLGENKKIFNKKFAFWWFYTILAYKKSKWLYYGKPRHRDHAYDYEHYSYIIDSEDFNEFLSNYTIEQFCDDSEIAERLRADLFYFIYCYLDLDKSPAHAEIHEILQQQEEERKFMEEMAKDPYKRYAAAAAAVAKYDYDVSELGYFRGDRIMN